jgi:hypothetical protein
MLSRWNGFHSFFTSQQILPAARSEFHSEVRARNCATCIRHHRSMASSLPGTHNCRLIESDGGQRFFGWESRKTLSVLHSLHSGARARRFLPRRQRTIDGENRSGTIVAEGKATRFTHDNAWFYPQLLLQDPFYC